MKLIEPNVTQIIQNPGLKGIFQQIERAGRLCYKSEDKITEDSAEKFVNMLIEKRHYAMLEHGTVYLMAKLSNDENYFDSLCHYKWNPYSNYSILTTSTNYKRVCVTTNYRVIVENDWQDDLQFICEPTSLHNKRYTFHFVTSIGITREIIRHRHMSFANESTRYCNYGKDKFDSEITFIKPQWANIKEITDKNKVKLSDGLSSWFNPNYIHIYGLDIPSKWFMKACLEAEYSYLHMINEQNMKPQEAREVLPLCTKSEIIVTGFESDWKNFLKLRCAKDVHPDIQYLANKVKEYFPVAIY